MPTLTDWAALLMLAVPTIFLTVAMGMLIVQMWKDRRNW